jgi:hypothetical protein
MARTIILLAGIIAYLVSLQIERDLADHGLMQLQSIVTTANAQATAIAVQLRP